MPFVIDDSDLSKVNIEALKRNLKAFTDCSAEDGKIWARWGAVSLQQHQSRFLCSNSFQSDLEPAPGAVHVVAFDKLVEMLAGCFIPGSSAQDIKAILKRTNVVILGANNVYIREACPKKSAAYVVPYPGGVKDLLGDDCKEMFSMYKGGDEVQ
eukprot:4091673-Amphidinium_carterae.2